MIGELFVIEARLREQELTGEAKKTIRQREAKPLVNKFFTWVQKQFDSQGLLPSSPLTKALSYEHERREGIEAYLNDPDVPIDTNHLERALRAIPMGRKNWLFCWTETGAEHVGVVQSLLTTCRLHDIDPYGYLVDVLQRVKNHPPLQMGELTPLRWKQLFAQSPKRSVPHLIDQMRKKSRLTQRIERCVLTGYDLPGSNKSRSSLRLTHTPRSSDPNRPSRCRCKVCVRA
jgi:transposase